LPISDILFDLTSAFLTLVGDTDVTTLVSSFALTTSTSIFSRDGGYGL